MFLESQLSALSQESCLLQIFQFKCCTKLDYYIARFSDMFRGSAHEIISTILSAHIHLSLLS